MIVHPGLGKVNGRRRITRFGHKTGGVQRGLARIRRAIFVRWVVGVGIVQTTPLAGDLLKVADLNFPGADHHRSLS